MFDQTKIDDSKSIAIKKELETRFIQNLLKGLEINAIATIRDINNIYEACIQPGDPIDQSEIARILKKSILVLYPYDKENKNKDQVLKWIKEISEYIEKLEEITPYANLPSAERGILNDIINYSGSNNKEAIKQKISELSNIIRIKEKELVRAKKENDRSTKLAISGLTLTVVFGIISILPWIKQTTQFAFNYLFNSTI